MPTCNRVSHKEWIDYLYGMKKLNPLSFPKGSCPPLGSARRKLMRLMGICVLTALSAWAVFQPQQASAQPHEGVYVHAGATVTSFTGGGISASFNKFGVQGGLGYNFAIDDHFYFALESNFTLKGNRTEVQQSGPFIDQGTTNLYYIQVPAMFGYELDNHISFFAGPAIGVLVSEESGNVFGVDQSQANFRTMDFSVAGGLRYAFSDHFGAMVRFDQSFLSIIDTGMASSAIQGGRRFNTGVGVSLYVSF